MLAFQVPSNCKTPVRAVLIAVCICVPVAKLEEDKFTAAVVTAIVGDVPPEDVTGAVAPTLVTVPVFDVLLLNVVQSELDKAPVADPLAVAIDIVGDVPPEEAIGDVAPTVVTPAEELVPAPIRFLTSKAVTPEANVGVPPPENIPGSANVVNPEGLLLLYGVNPNPLVTLADVKNNVPPRDKLPEVDTLPDNDNPLTLPVPDTFVTVPVLVVNPELLKNILRGIVDICVFFT